MLFVSTINLYGQLERDEVWELSNNSFEIVAREFQNLAHSFNYEELRKVTTADFEFLIFGSRMTFDEFEGMLRSMEAERHGEPLGIYEISEFHTRFVGDVAYSSWIPEEWLESSIFIRVGDRWLVDRAFAIPIELADE